MNRLLTIIILILACTSPVSTDETKFRVSVVPLGYSEGVLATDAEMLGRLFETALVRSGAFTVVTRPDMEKVLEAQEASLNDFADREFAVDLGRIISASHIFVGSVAKLGRNYVVNLQLVNVENGRTIMAEVAETTSVEGFLEAMRYLADLFSGSDTKVDAQQATNYQARMYLTIGDRFMDLRRYEPAIAQYEKALALDEFNVDILWRIVTGMKEDLLSQSFYTFNAISSGLDVALRSDYRRLHLVDREDVDAILEKIYTIQSIDPLLRDDVALLLDEARVFKIAGQVDDALIVLRRAFKMCPEDPFVLAELGLLIVLDAPQTPEGKVGLELIQKAVAASSETALLHFYLGRSLERQNGFPSAAALRAYRDASELSFRSDFWSRRIRAFALQSMQRIYYRMGSLEGGVLTEELDMGSRERLELMEYLAANEVPFSTSTPVQNPDYYLAQLYYANGKIPEAQTALLCLLPEDPDEWRSFQVPWLELYEKILARSGKDPKNLSTVRAKLKSFR